MSATNAEAEAGFLPMPVRIAGELADRKSLAARALKYYHMFLDDCLRGILPNDLVLIGAPSGMGKTDLALSIASSNASQKRRVSYFALEAEPRELERRTKYNLLSTMVHKSDHPQKHEMNYADWLLAKCEHLCSAHNSSADQQMLEALSGLCTFYRGSKFDAADLQRWILKIHQDTDLIIVDHLHYVDAADDNDNEAKSLGDTVKTIRDVALNIGKPIILVAHLRKRDRGGRQLVSTLDDFHGSSNVVKIATQAFTIEHAVSVETTKWYLAPTFMSVLKDRRAGAPRLVALVNFDRRRRCYQDHYTLGRLTKGGTEWEALGLSDVPSWAKHNKQMETT